MNDSTAITDNVVDDSGAFDLKPKCGMEFDTEQDAYDFYNEYGGKVGFGIRKYTHNKNKTTGELTSRIFVCCKAGVRGKDKRDYLTKKSRQEVRTNCDARMIIKLNRHKGKYVVNEFKEEHNHPFVIPECIHMLPSQRKMSNSQAIEVELAEESGIPLRSAYELMGRQVGGRESLGYIKRDQKNYLRTRRQQKMAFGEAGSILGYFRKQSVDNPSFFYAVQLDCDEQMTNLFWADARMIIDYNLFGDVVSFDTTYKINKENRPFAVFVGFNHHRETVVFGAALMYDETADSFVWLFETFLEAMSNKAPKTIFTDQDSAMASAIVDVMPNTFHRLCRWHMNQNALKHVNNEVRSVLSQLMNYVEDKAEFLATWNHVLDHHELHDSLYMKILFNIKEKWGHVYVRGKWSAGMKSTQLSESFNRSLKDYLKSDHDVVQFFMHFERVLNDKRYKELEAEYSLCYKLPKVQVPVTMLIQAGNTYTQKIFEKFQKQYVLSLEARVETCFEDGENVVYAVATHGHSRMRQVTKERDNTIYCSCMFFEMRGYLCSHAIKVLNVMNIMELPNQYILKRWTRKARAECVQDKHGRAIMADAKLQRTTWYRSLCSIFTRISSRASESEETYKISNEKANELLKMVEDMLSSHIDGNVQDNVNHTSPSITCEGNNEARCLDNAIVVQAKGLKKRAQSTHRGKRRIKSSLEIALAKKKRPSNSHLPGGSVPTHIDGMTGMPFPQPPSQSYETPLHMFHMGGNVLCPPTMYQTNSVPLTNYIEPQRTSFQALLQQNTMGYAFSLHDSQLSNNTTYSQAMDLNTSDNIHTTSNSNHIK